MHYYTPKNPDPWVGKKDREKLSINTNEFEQKGLEALRRWHMRRNYVIDTPNIVQTVVVVDYQFSDYHLWVGYDLASMEVIAVNMCRFCTEIEATIFLKEVL